MGDKFYSVHDQEQVLTHALILALDLNSGNERGPEFAREMANKMAISIVRTLIDAGWKIAPSEATVGEPA